MQFIRINDRLFYILNSRNPWAKGFNSALSVNKKGFWYPFLDTAFEFLNLKDAAGQPMHTTRRKTGFVGFLLAISSIEGIFHDFVEANFSPLQYLLTYKLRQDHLELFYSAIPSARGFNDNKKAEHFTAKY